MEQSRDSGLRNDNLPAIGRLPNGKNYLFVVGINRYESMPTLYNAVHDAQVLRDVLFERYQFEPIADRVFELFDSEATREHIIDQFDWLVRHVTEDDNLFVYFSGHGEMQGSQGYWLPVDARPERTATWIANSQISDYIGDIKAHHIVVVSDSCYSGALFRKVENPSERLESIPSRWLLTSGMVEPVSDGKPGDHSPFADNLIYYLKNNNSRQFSILDLIQYVTLGTASNARQRPTGGRFFGTDDRGAGYFYFRLKQDEAGLWQECLERNEPETFAAYLQAYPEGIHREEAASRQAILLEDRAWEQARKIDTLLSYNQYLSLYRNRPGARYVDEASLAVRRLEEQQLWNRALSTRLYSDYDAYLKAYPGGRFVGEAQEALQRIVSQSDEEDAWKRAREADSADAIRAYLAVHGEGSRGALARERLQELEAEQDWKQAQEAGTFEAVAAYLERHPDRPEAGQARTLLTKLKKQGEQSAWQQAAAENTIKAYQRFLKAFPDSRFAGKANEAIEVIRAGKSTSEEETAWNNARKTGYLFSYKQFVQAYPASKYRREADEQIRILRRKKSGDWIENLFDWLKIAGGVVLLAVGGKYLFCNDNTPKVLVIYTDGTRFGYKTENGDVIIKAVYEGAKEFSEGLACVKQNGKWGFIDSDGKQVINFLYDKGGTFSNGTATVVKGSVVYAIDKNGKETVKGIALDTTGSAARKILTTPKDTSRKLVPVDRRLLRRPASGQ